MWNILDKLYFNDYIITMKGKNKIKNENQKGGNGVTAKEWARIKKVCAHKVAMEAVHQSYIDNPPIRNGKRLMGSAIRSCFWEGFDGTKIRIIDNTPCHSAWKAGRYHRRKINKDGNHWKQFENYSTHLICADCGEIHRSPECDINH